MTPPPRHTDRIVAHRGAPATHPENSLVGILAARAAGARCFEVDVQLTADGVPVLHHDRDLRRLTGRRGRVSGFGFRELQGLDFGERRRFAGRFAGTPPTRLAQVAEALADPDLHLFVEYKAQPESGWTHREILAAMRSELAGAGCRWTLIGFDAGLLHAARAAGLEDLGWILPRWSRASLAQAREAAWPWLFCDARRVPPTVAELPRLPGQWVIYVVDELVRVRRWQARGARLVETDAFAALAEGERAHPR